MPNPEWVIFVDRYGVPQDSWQEKIVVLTTGNQSYYSEYPEITVVKEESEAWQFKIAQVVKLTCSYLARFDCFGGFANLGHA